MGILSNRANFQDIDGLLWGWQWAPNQANGHTQLSYAFPTSAADYGYTVTGFQPFNAAQRAAATRAIANYDAVCNLDFVFTTDGPRGNIRFAEADSFSFTHNGNFTWNGDSAYGVAPDNASSLPAAQGDTWFNHTSSYNAPTIGSFGYFAGFLHEMGHALGLKHGHEQRNVYDVNLNVLYTNPALPAAHDGQEYSVMTYRAYPGAPLAIFTQEGPSTLMQDDIYALQWMYGANYDYNSGNTTYRWSAATGEMVVNGAHMGVPFHNKVLMTVWDGGGIDTYDFSNFATPATVDLRIGAWSTPSRALLADLDSRADVTHLARGCIANAMAFKGDYRCYIENAWGGSGNDAITGNELGNDLRGNGGNDRMNGGAGNDTLSGGAGNDVLDGGAGNDTLTGGAGKDALRGGIGNDTYYSDAGDTISEAANAGTDRVHSAVSHALGANLEDLILDGTAAINGTGNALDNLLLGNAAANTLNGGPGNDTLFGMAGNDRLAGGPGADRLDGGFGNDVLDGGAGDDTLTGGPGKDALRGGAGNDTYYSDAGDTISEAANAGADTVHSLVSHALGSNLENLVLDGTAAINGAGNALANTLVGNAATNALSGGAGDDTLFGQGGNDRLAGGAGLDSLSGGLDNDVLTGGAGNDTFAFNTAPSTTTNRDTITDFAKVAGNNDWIVLENAIFTPLGGGAPHLLNQAFFRAAAAALDANDFIVYNRATGALFYDADGNGAGGAIQFATLATKPMLAASDFLVI